MPRPRATVFAFVCAIAALAALSASPALADPGNGSASLWKLGYYTSSGQTLSFATVPQGGGAATFNFTAADNTALLVTDHGSLKGTDLGNLAGKTITATFDISGATGAFTYYGQPDACGTPASVRLYFQTDNGGGFAYTHYWWSNPESRVLANGTHFTLTANVLPVEWSDWNGQNGATQLTGFNDAAGNVTTIGFSFGGGCFFENGVGTTDGSGTFKLDSFAVSP